MREYNLPKRITNPLREGIPSKIYLLAFNGPVSGYGVAKKVYSVEKYPPTAKIMVWMKQLVKEGAIFKTKEGYISNVEPLINEICRTLFDRGVELSDLESYMVIKLLGHEAFRNLVEFSYYYQKGFFTREIDAAHEIMEVLGHHALLSSVYDSDGNAKIKTQAEFDALWNESGVSREFTPEEIEESPEIRQRINAFKEEDEIFQRTGHFKKGGIYEALEKQGRLAREGKKVKEWAFPIPKIFPQTLTDKLCKLSSSYDLFQKVLSGRNAQLFELWLSKKAKEESTNQQKTAKDSSAR
jgi:hypothetical protein